MFRTLPCHPGGTTSPGVQWANGRPRLIGHFTRALPHTHAADARIYANAPMSYVRNYNGWSFLGCLPDGYNPANYTNVFGVFVAAGGSVVIEGGSGGVSAPEPIPGQGLKARLAQIAGVPGAELVEAANIIAGTNRETAVTALNIAAGTTGESMKTALNVLAGTSGEEAVVAARKIGGYA